jgi:PAS domain S-box-containing protein
MPVRSLLGKRSSEGPTNADSGAPGFALGDIVSNHTEPALLVDATANVVVANQLGSALAAAITRRSLSGIIRRIAEVSTTGCPAVDRAELHTSEGHRTLDITFIPDGNTPVDKVALLAHDVTSDRNLTNALVASRQLFKDLVGCSSEFSWEIRADRTFSFVSPRAALGFTARRLEGQPARDLLDADHALPATLPFEAKVAVDEIEIWVRQVDASLACLEVSSVPVFGDDGGWLGARGVCRDVTEARERDVALQRAGDREELQARIINSMRNEIDTRRM